MFMVTLSHFKKITCTFMQIKQERGKQNANSSWWNQIIFIIFEFSTYFSTCNYRTEQGTSYTVLAAGTYISGSLFKPYYSAKGN